MKVASIYALILLILIYFHNDYTFDTFIGYVIGTVLMYTVAIGAAEFQLLAYCRFKFLHLTYHGSNIKERLQDIKRKIKKVNQNVRRKGNEYSRFKCSSFTIMWKEYEGERK